MAWKRPIDLRGKKALLDDKRFYRLLSEQSNYMDPDSAFLFYTSLVALIEQELRRHKVIRLPHLGDLAMAPQRPRAAWIGKTHAVIGHREILRFYPKKRLKRYFALRQGPLSYSEILPPPALR